MILVHDGLISAGVSAHGHEGTADDAVLYLTILRIGVLRGYEEVAYVAYVFDFDSCHWVFWYERVHFVAVEVCVVVGAFDHVQLNRSLAGVFVNDDLVTAHGTDLERRLPIEDAVVAS